MGLASYGISLFFALCACIVSHYFGIVDFDFVNSREYKFYKSLLEFSDSTRHGGAWKKIAIGFNANFDIVVNGVDLMKRLKIEPGKAINQEEIETFDQLKETFQWYFDQDSHGMKHVSSESLFNRLMKEARAMPKHRLKHGGDALLIAEALKFHNSNASLLLGAPLTDEMKAISGLSGSLTSPTKCLKEKQDELDYHLVLEWEPSDTYGDSVPGLEPRYKNNLILSSDHCNANLYCMDSFFKAIPEFQPELLILAGLHLLSSLEPTDSNIKIDSISKYLKTVPKESPIHLELSGIKNKDLLSIISQKLMPLVDSVGLSDEELILLNEIAKGPHRDLTIQRGVPIQGGFAMITDIINYFLNYYAENIPGSRLTRIHFHCSAFHVIGLRGSVWGNTVASISHSSLTFSKLACGTHALNVVEHKILVPDYFALTIGNENDQSTVTYLNPNSPITVFGKDGHEFYMLPVLVCQNPEKIGSWNNVMAAALMKAFFNSTMARNS